MRFSLDKNGERVCIDDADRSEIYYCPECGEKMVQRHGEIMTPCFAHYPNTQCIDNWHYDESEWHYRFQSRFPKENQELVLEFEGKKHLADVCYEDRKIVIEIQGERLRQTEFEARNEFFQNLGYHVIWVFDQSRIFENESINYGYRRMACSRDWDRPSRVFQGFFPQQEQGVEVWFQRSDSGFDDQPRFFRVLKSINALKTMDCGFCHSLKELMRYLKEGKKTPDYGSVYDIKYPIKRSDGTMSIFFCPRKPSEPFAPEGACGECPFRMHINAWSPIDCVGCTCRIEKMNWDIGGEIQSFSRRNDGFVESIVLVDENGEAKQIKLDNPDSFLRTLPDLWTKYKPRKYIVCYNANTKHTWRVFNPGWQRYKKGVIKGYIVDYRGRTVSRETEIEDAEKLVWFVRDTI